MADPDAERVCAEEGGAGSRASTDDEEVLDGGEKGKRGGGNARGETPNMKSHFS